MSYRWWSSCRTTTGRQRRVNEDAFLGLDEAGLWLVADGMGGHARGDVASRLIVEAFDGLVRPRSLDDFASEVKARLALANQRMRAEARKAGSDQLMGSTVVAFLAYKREWMCLWAGDSRAYLLRDGRLLQITRDHSLAEELVQRGELHRDEAALHPSANRITRAVGTQDQLVVDQYRSFLRDGDAVLLCSDGLNKEVCDEEVAAVLEDYDCDEASRELVELTLERGARDNVTVAVIRFEATTGFGDHRPDDTAVNYAFTQRRHLSARRAPVARRREVLEPAGGRV
ncbi:MAG: protein phosphatase 2C domain-containing protein [Gammaproteobacteria bacterium]|jgi:protein phosphatase